MSYLIKKRCAVPKCLNTAKRNPEKLFIYVPHSENIRRKWLEVAGKDHKNLSTSTLYFCEDHFDLENDMENFTEYKLMGNVGRIRLKPGCIPTKFQCQSGRGILRHKNKSQSMPMIKQENDLFIENQSQSEVTTDGTACTSAMGNHLKKKHPEEFQAIVKDKVVEPSPFHYVVIDPILTTSIKQECDDPEEEEEYSENKTHINDSSNDIEETSRDTTTDVHKKRKFVDSPPPQKKQISESYTMEVLKCMKTLTETMAKRDEYSIYGEHIANKLRNSCRTEVEIAIAQHEIDNICYKLTMGEYCQMAENQASSSGVFIKQSPTISEYSPTLSEHSPTM